MAGPRRTNRQKPKSGNSLKAQRVLVRAVLIIAIFGSIFYMIYSSASSLGNIFFSNNPYFTLNKYKIETRHEGNLTNMHVFRKELEKVFETVELKNNGKINLFKLDLRLIRNVLLEDNNQLADIKIIRKLPEGLEVIVIDKTPIARLYNRNGPFIDRKGFVIPFVKALNHLPIILGVHNRKSVKEGEITMNSDINCTLRLLNHLASSPYGPLFDLILVNCSTPDQLSISLHETKEYFIAPKCTVIVPRKDLAGGLNRAAQIFDKRQSFGKPTLFIDATYEVNVPIR